MKFYNFTNEKNGDVKKMKTIIDEIEEYENLQKNIIAKIGDKILHGIEELLKLKKEINSKFTGYILEINQEMQTDFNHISLYIKQFEFDGISQTILKYILNYELKYSYLYWIDPACYGLILHYIIKSSD